MQTRFIGRSSDLARVVGLWSRGERLVTLWGPGGMGKTRLAQECAARWPHAWWFCDLSRAADLDALCSVVARSLRVPPARRRAVDQIGRALEHQGPCLLVLDNFEQLVDECAPVLLDWLRQAPGLSLLLTSRQRLRLPGEVSHELLPLGLPGEAGERDEAALSDAVSFFVACARSVAPAFEARGAQLAQVAELVARLEGIPLAIELAASRVDVLGPGELLRRLPAGLGVLGGARRGVDARQSSFREAIGWSWELLSESEQRALAQCAVFSKHFTLIDAESILEVGADVLLTLESLRDKSMLRSAQSEGVSRLSMYESLRSFAHERLVASGELEPTQARHARYFQAKDDRENQTAALRFYLERADAPGSLEAALGLMLAVEPALATQGPFREHAGLLSQVLAACEGAPLPAASLARLRAARARLRASQGDEAGAHEDAQQALALARRGGDAGVTAAVLIDQGILHHQRRQFPEAEGCYQAALGELAAGPDGLTRARALGNLGALLHDARKPDQARAAYAQALASFRRHDDQRLEGIFLANLALLEQESGRLPEARVCLERAAALLSGAGDARLLGITLGNLGALCHEQGDPEQAREFLKNALDSLRRVGDLRSEALALARVGAAEASLGLDAAAQASIDHAEALLLRVGDRVALRGLPAYRSFVCLAQAASLLHLPAQAAAALAQARALLRAVTEPAGAEPPPWELLDDVRTALRIARPWAARLDLSLRPDELPADALLVGPDASWFQAPGAEAQDLRPRRALRALLDLLVRRRIDGQGADAADLLEAAWPGEKMSPEAALNRVRVALAELRKRGLRACLLRDGERYRLDPAVPVRLAALPWEELTTRRPPDP